MSTITIIRGSCPGADLQATMAKIEAANPEVVGAAMVMKKTNMGWEVDYVVTARVAEGIRGLTADLVVLDEVA
ncbi:MULTISPECIES: hypothetical protein [unclassified Marinobacter]|uniref:hypothetical protein n=1 Tax=unclassified Marinobacter TaxID=83889 RepID=UPI001267FED0|nr:MULTISPECIES: hypothetical protein [unclassified Marinobacter]QFS87572.1 hypothetical protein FIV08_12135 [Marinobacter sp. THAF197a]QFT51357.1 hypothetical protein FIU96_12050 [Marinobacter sp. THAF39]